MGHGFLREFDGSRRLREELRIPAAISEVLIEVSELIREDGPQVVRLPYQRWARCDLAVQDAESWARKLEKCPQ